MPEPRATDDAPTPTTENDRCESCGRWGAVEIAGRPLCDDCRQGCGSCCPEFGKDDLWAEDL
jgi:hypothetical protein